MKNMFNLRLYLEGLKKLKLIGIAASIVCVGLSALVPTVYMISESKRNINRGYTYDVEIGQFAIPLILILFFAPFFVKSIFSYLNYRNESDFYHSIPYKRVTVFNSFMLAAFTWVLAIITVSVAVCGVLWAVSPGATYDAGYIPLLILATFVSCVLLMCFMSLAMNLTGTPMSNIFIFGLLACFTRVLLFLFTSALENCVPIWRAGNVVGMIAEIGFYFPIALLGCTVEIFEAAQVYSNLPLYIYTVVVSICLYVAGAYLYHRRKSEMAGKSAPSNRLQHIYRIAFTTPFVLILATFISVDLYGNEHYDIEEYLIMFVGVALVYFLYELITTKTPKNMLKAIPYCLILVVVGMIYVGAVGAVRTSVLYNIPEADEIASVVFSPSDDDLYGGRPKEFEEIMTDNVAVTDSEVVKAVADTLKVSAQAVEDGTFTKRREYITYKDFSDQYRSYTFYEVKINLSNGQSIRRNLKMYSDEYAQMMHQVKQTKEYGDAYLKIPEPEDIYWVNGYETDDAKALYECYYEEYGKFDREAKLAAKEIGTEFYQIVVCNGRDNFENYEFKMVLSLKTPKTLQMYSDIVADESSDYYSYDKYGKTEEKSNQETQKMLFDLYREKGDALFDNEKNQKVLYYNMSIDVYDGEGKYLGTVRCDTDNQKHDFKKGLDMIEAIEEYADGIYSSGKYILIVNTTYQSYKNEQNNNNYYYSCMFMYANARINSLLSQYYERNEYDDIYMYDKVVKE